MATTSGSRFAGAPTRSKKLKRILFLILVILAVGVAAAQDQIRVPGSSKNWVLQTDETWDGTKWIPTAEARQSQDPTIRRNSKAWAPLDAAPQGVDQVARLYRNNPRTSYPPTGSIVNYRMPNGYFQYSNGTRVNQVGGLVLNGQTIPLVYRSYDTVLLGDMHFKKSGNTYYGVYGYIKKNTPMLAENQAVRRVRYRAEHNGRAYWLTVLVDAVWASPQCGNFTPIWAPRFTVAEVPIEVKKEVECKTVEIMVERYYYTLERETQVVVQQSPAQVIVVAGGTGRWSLQSVNAAPVLRSYGGLGMRVNVFRGVDCPILTCDPNGTPPDLPGIITVPPPGGGTPPNNPLNSDPDHGVGNPPPTA